MGDKAEDANLAWIHRTDQIKEGAGDLAILIATFWKDLIKNGVGKREATEITAAWVSALQSQFHQGENPP